MKKLFTISAILFFYFIVIFIPETKAQAPGKMSYQAVIRNASGNLVINQTVGMKISILQTSATGTPVYVETQTPQTNANGLVSLQIGSGTVVSGSISGIDWSAGPYFIKTQTDPSGGTTYSITGTSELLSVPYTLFAANAANAANGNWDKNGNDISNSNSGNIGIGTTTPSTAKLVISGTPTAEGLDLSSTDQYANLRVIHNSLGSADNDMYIGFGSGATSSLHLFTDNYEAVTIAAGNVGIGTATPAARLHVNGTAYINGDSASFDFPNWAPGINTVIAGNFTAKGNTNLGPQARFNANTGANFYDIGMDGNLGFTIEENDNARITIAPGGNVGIGTTSPMVALDVNGNFRMTDGTQGVGKILTSDIDGVASWQPAPVTADLSANIYGSPAFVMADGVSYTADFSNVHYIDNMIYSNGNITVPASGVYHFDVFVATCYMYINNINLQILTNINGNLYDQNYSNSLSIDLKLNANDAVSFTLIQSSGSSQTLCAFSRLNCHKVN